MADDLSFPSSSSCKSKQNPNFPCIILHDLSLLCSFIASYPLYISYFIFFSPYFMKLISYISPLFIATVFLSLLLTTTTTFCPKLPHLELEILQSVIQELKFNLHDVNGDEDDRNFEDFEIYRIVFDGTLLITVCNGDDDEAASTKNILENAEVTTIDSDSDTDSETDKLVIDENPEITSDFCTDRSGTEKVIENSVHDGCRADYTTSDSVTDRLNVEKIQRNSFHSDVTITDSELDELESEKGFEKLLTELARFEDLTTANETNTSSDKVSGAFQKVEPALLRETNSSENDKLSENSYASDSSNVLTSHGSMKEEEWRRTLACKLYEERHNSGRGEEGMDSLWEAHENDNSKNRKEIMMHNNGGINSFSDFDDDCDEDDEIEMSNGHLCCLQALKLSTGKMNLGLGMGKLKIVRFSKEVKGFGWLNLVKKKKHGKKR